MFKIKIQIRILTNKLNIKNFQNGICYINKLLKNRNCLKKKLNKDKMSQNNKIQSILLLQIYNQNINNKDYSVKILTMKTCHLEILIGQKNVKKNQIKLEKMTSIKTQKIALSNLKLYNTNFLI